MQNQAKNSDSETLSKEKMKPEKSSDQKKSSKIGSGFMLAVVLIVFCIIVTLQQLKYPTDLEINATNKKQFDTVYNNMLIDEKLFKDNYQKIVDKQKQKEQQEQQAEQQRLIKEAQDQAQQNEYIDNIKEYIQEGDYDDDFDQTDIQNAITLTKENLQKCFLQRQVRYPIGSIIPMIQFYKGQLNKKYYTPGIQENNGIFFIPLIGGTIYITSQLYNQFKLFWTLIGAKKDQLIFIPNGYNKVLRQEKQNMLQSYQTQPGFIKFDPNEYIKHSKNNIEQILSDIKGSPEKITQSLKLEDQYLPIENIKMQSFSKTLTNPDNNGVSYGDKSSHVFVKLVDQSLYNEKLEEQDVSQYQQQYYKPTMEKKDIEMCVLDNHINTIYIMIIGYIN